MVWIYLPLPPLSSSPLHVDAARLVQLRPQVPPTSPASLRSVNHTTRLLSLRQSTFFVDSISSDRLHHYKLSSPAAVSKKARPLPSPLTILPVPSQPPVHVPFRPHHVSLTLHTSPTVNSHYAAPPPSLSLPAIHTHFPSPFPAPLNSHGDAHPHHYLTLQHLPAPRSPPARPPSSRPPRH